MSKQNYKCQGYESFQRMNYLFQIQNYIVTSSGNLALSSYYGKLLSNIAKKSVLKIDPAIKRKLCKNCKCILIPDKSCSVRIKNKKKNKLVLWKCAHCGWVKKFPVSTEKTIWLERPESVVQIIECEN